MKLCCENTSVAKSHAHAYIYMAHACSCLHIHGTDMLMLAYTWHAHVYIGRNRTFFQVHISPQRSVRMHKLTTSDLIDNIGLEEYKLIMLNLKNFLSVFSKVRTKFHSKRNMFIWARTHAHTS